MNYAKRNNVQYINPATVLSMNPSHHVWTAIDRLSAILEKEVLNKLGRQTAQNRPEYQVRAFKIAGIIDLKMFKVNDAEYIVRYKARSSTIGLVKSRAVSCNMQERAVTRLYDVCTPVHKVELDLTTVSGSVFINEIKLIQRIVRDHSVDLDVQQYVDMLVQLMETQYQSNHSSNHATGAR